MNLLLLLSALLSALTGVGAGVRQPQPAAAVVQQARTIDPAQVRAARAEERPVAPLPVLPAVAAAMPVALDIPAAAVPLYLTRLRE